MQNSCHRVELLRVKALGRNYSVIMPVTVKLEMSGLEMSGVDCTDLIIASSLRTHLNHKMIPVLVLKCNEVEVEPAQNNHVDLPQASSHIKNMAIKASNNLFSFLIHHYFGIFDNLLFEKVGNVINCWNFFIKKKKI